MSRIMRNRLLENIHTNRGSLRVPHEIVVSLLGMAKVDLLSMVVRMDRQIDATEATTLRSSDTHVALDLDTYSLKFYQNILSSGEIAIPNVEDRGYRSVDRTTHVRDLVRTLHLLVALQLPAVLVAKPLTWDLTSLCRRRRRHCACVGLVVHC